MKAGGVKMVPGSLRSRVSVWNERYEARDAVVTDLIHLTWEKETLMETPLALTGMISVEAKNQEAPQIADWTWQPQILDAERLTNALMASSQTSRQTWSKQTDHGEGK